jgi:hypothetical protein
LSVPFVFVKLFVACRANSHFILTYYRAIEVNKAIKLRQEKSFMKLFKGVSMLSDLIEKLGSVATLHTITTIISTIEDELSHGESIPTAIKDMAIDEIVSYLQSLKGK